MAEITEDERKRACSDLFERIDRFGAEVEGLVRLCEKCTDPYVAQVVYDQYEAKKGLYKEMEQELQKLGELCEANRTDTDRLKEQGSRLRNSFERCQRLKDGLERSR